MTDLILGQIGESLVKLSIACRVMGKIFNVGDVNNGPSLLNLWNPQDEMEQVVAHTPRYIFVRN